MLARVACDFVEAHGCDLPRDVGAEAHPDFKRLWVDVVSIGGGQLRGEYRHVEPEIAAVMLNALALEIPPPGAGLKTVTAAVPAGGDVGGRDDASAARR